MAIYAAADGHVLRVDTPGDDTFLRGPCHRVVTFLSLFDVHVNRSPVAGTITLLERQQGGFAATFNVAASDRNAAELVGIEGEHGRVLVRRTAGLIARRILTWTRFGQHVDAGLKLGMLKFGSRTDVLFPLGAAQVLVKEGDYVRAGRTVIARYHQTPS